MLSTILSALAVPPSRRPHPRRLFLPFARLVLVPGCESQWVMRHKEITGKLTNKILILALNGN